ncbi:dihydrolipoamide acetyltransferase family protein [Paenibacillus sp. J2TS4]|uniref:dihydrolipoamide acetyltransferase family protein n=1 Tax=Paenibacillus sp. J2TS4 TaxID=2807194 RepID=UPI001B007F6D|nr:dihydrolipoamide acetyltransferase family protein [Paenibacillus sp. J2TS4]GIP32294.1 lipoamide acyltransferase component of branched-chain alpha-keto acid dehydrogenase complex [Paenibacillus sp. J2TS4]
MNQTKGREVEVTVPHLAETLVSATVGQWLKQPGDYIRKYDVLCELMTEKVNVEMPSTVEGTLTEIRVQEGETADVGDVLCIVRLENTGAEAEGAAAPESYDGGSSKLEETEQASGSNDMRSRLSPAVLKLASEHDIDLNKVKGTGLGGRITRKDVLTYADQRGEGTARNSESGEDMRAEELKQPQVPVRTSGLHLSQDPPISWVKMNESEQQGSGDHFIDVSPIRHTIASRTRQSVTEIPHAWTMIEVDVTNLVVLRNKWKDDFRRKEGINLTYLAFLLKAVVSAIRDYPIMNSVWGVDKIIVKRDINLSLAVGTEDMVVTPVIKNADQKNIAGLAREIDRLTKKARAGKLGLDDIQGGTFTVNNTGSFGSILSYPIINYPQAAILTFESIVKKPVVIQDMIAVRSMVNLCLSLDHRILDGVICGRFLQRVKENMESFNAETNIY